MKYVVYRNDGTFLFMWKVEGEIETLYYSKEYGCMIGFDQRSSMAKRFDEYGKALVECQSLDAIAPEYTYTVLTIKS